MCRQAADLGQIRDLPEGVSDLALRHFMGDHNDLSAASLALNCTMD